MHPTQHPPTLADPPTTAPAPRPVSRYAGRTTRPSPQSYAHTPRSRSAPIQPQHRLAPHHPTRPTRRSPATNHRTYERNYRRPTTRPDQNPPATPDLWLNSRLGTNPLARDDAATPAAALKIG